MPNSKSKRYQIELGKFEKLVQDKSDDYRTLVIGTPKSGYR